MSAIIRPLQPPHLEDVFPNDVFAVLSHHKVAEVLSKLSDGMKSLQLCIRISDTLENLSCKLSVKVMGAVLKERLR